MQSTRTTNKPPTIQRRRLAAELRLLRDRAQLTLEEVAQKLHWSVAKISRIETAVVGISSKDLGQLLDMYGVEGERRTALLSKTRTARTRGWWDAYAEFVPSDYIDYIELEAQLSGMRSYDANVIHGLMQTEAYAREIIRGADHGPLVASRDRPSGGGTPDPAATPHPGGAPAAPVDHHRRADVALDGGLARHHGRPVRPAPGVRRAATTSPFRYCPVSCRRAPGDGGLVRHPGVPEPARVRTRCMWKQ